MRRVADKLSQLRRETGAEPEAAVPSPTLEHQADLERLDLSQRLRALTRHRVVPHLDGSRLRLSDADLAQALGGECIAEGLLRFVVRIPWRTHHGQGQLEAPHADGLGVLPGHSDVDAKSLIYFDTETTGLSSGSGTLCFMVGFARPERDGLEVQQFLMTRFAGETALLNACREQLQDRAAIATYNGKSFDQPILQMRYRLAGAADPLDGVRHLDLLPLTRALFAHKWPDCRLRTAEQRLLGFHRHNDLPGSEAPQVWFDWVRRGQIRRLPAVLQHNLWDVVSLARLLEAICCAFRDPPAANADPHAMARYYLRQGSAEAAWRLLLSERERLDDEGTQTLATLARRRGEWSVCLELWVKLANREVPQAIEALAKYYEHVERDLGRALTHTQRLIALQGRNDTHARRENRLLKKLDGTPTRR